MNFSPSDILDQLKQGNQRFLNDQRVYPHLDKERLRELDGGQKPLAAIFSCSDSRVPPEHIFDQGLGDLFVIRVAGNVCDTHTIASIEFGVGVLKIPLVVVMGHTQCGAVMAVANNVKISGNIPTLVETIKPAVEQVKEENPNLPVEEIVLDAVKQNVWQSIDTLLSQSEMISEAVQSGNAQVIGAVYHVEDGHVEWLGEHPHS